MNKKRLDVFIVVLMAITGFAIGAIAGFSAKNDVENALTETTVSQETTEQTTVEETTEIELTTVKNEDILKLRELDRFKITGYTPTCKHCCGKTDCIGASGRKIVVGESVAMNRADMKSFGLEYGDKIYIEGIGERVIVDTGCGQGVVDVACDSHASCRAITGYYRVHYVIE
jgi:3D (Asp-Asp-Asp) domain-containing protein